MKEPPPRDQNAQCMTLPGNGSVALELCALGLSAPLPGQGRRSALKCTKRTFDIGQARNNGRARWRHSVAAIDRAPLGTIVYGASAYPASHDVDRRLQTQQRQIVPAANSVDAGKAHKPAASTGWVPEPLSADPPVRPSNHHRCACSATWQRLD